MPELRGPAQDDLETDGKSPGSWRSHLKSLIDESLVAPRPGTPADVQLAGDCSDGSLAKKPESLQSPSLAISCACSCATELLDPTGIPCSRTARHGSVCSPDMR